MAILVEDFDFVACLETLGIWALHCCASCDKAGLRGTSFGKTLGFG
jgi:hypothetical protein